MRTTAAGFRIGPIRVLRSAGCAVLAALLTACASTAPPDRLPALALPEAWPAAGGRAGDATTLVQWWQRFDDPLLGTLVELALRVNTSVAGAQASVRQAQALRDIAAAALWPTLGASASASRSDSGSTGGSTRGGSTSANSFQTGLNANWAPDVFGASRQALAASNAAADASAASLGDMQVQVAAEVGLSYISLRATQLRLDIARDNLASQQDTLQITLWRQQAGLASELDAVQARASVEQTRALLPAFQTAIEQNINALAVLTGRAPGTASGQAAQLAASAPVPLAADELVLGIPAETLRQRADVRASEYQVAAALARVRQADAARWPGFSIAGTMGYGAATLGALGNSASLATSVLASVTLPLFDGGALRAQVRAQQAALDLAQASYRAAVLAALQDVENALAALQGDRLRLLSLREAASAAGHAAELARQQYSSGLVDFQTVLSTERTRLGTQDAVAQASADVSSDQVRLFKALGGGWRAGDGGAGPPLAQAHPGAVVSRP